jgi:DNA-binding transcriptional regulator GbsR (MarR family)
LPEQCASTEREVADFVGRLMQFWGFKRAMGRLWTALYLSPSPLTGADLAHFLGMSAGAVSMGLAELEHWRCVKRTHVPGDRHDYFVAETDIWAMVRHVLTERELALVTDFSAALTRASAELEAVGPAAPDAELALRHKHARLTELRDLARVGEMLLRALVEGKVIDPMRLTRAAESAPGRPTSPS